MARNWKWFKARTVPFLKSLLCFDFFARLVFFVGLTYFVSLQMRDMSQEKVTLKQEGGNSPNRYSKTFGREEALDKLLASADDQELLKNLGKEGDSDKETAVKGKNKKLSEQPGHAKKL